MPPPLTRASLKRAATKESAVETIKQTTTKDKDSKKRSVFSDITNAKKTQLKETKGKTTKDGEVDKTIKKKEKDILYKLNKGEIEDVCSQQSDPSTQQTNISSGSVYLTADDTNSITDTSLDLTETKDDSRMSFEEAKTPVPMPNVSPRKDLPYGVRDYDLDNWRDPAGASSYAMDIFDYLKEREKMFAVKNYIEHQPLITKPMRAILVDWLVEVQESFELNHEALYLAVKLVDLFLDRTKQFRRELLQLVGVTAIFIACKFDERCPPGIDDFMYICDDAYSRKQMLAMERKILSTVNFDLGAPLSYSFLRRYARCANYALPTLTLARFILETSLMEYNFVSASESKLAAASLYLALKMEKHDWTPVLQYYSGYGKNDLCILVNKLNVVMHESKQSEMKVIQNKYSHEAFFKVSKIPLLPLND